MPLLTATAYWTAEASALDRHSTRLHIKRNEGATAGARYQRIAAGASTPGWRCGPAAGGDYASSGWRKSSARVEQGPGPEDLAAAAVYLESVGVCTSVCDGKLKLEVFVDVRLGEGVQR